MYIREKKRVLFKYCQFVIDIVFFFRKQKNIYKIKRNEKLDKNKHCLDKVFFFSRILYIKYISKYKKKIHNIFIYIRTIRQAYYIKYVKKKLCRMNIICSIIFLYIIMQDNVFYLYRSQRIIIENFTIYQSKTIKFVYNI